MMSKINKFVFVVCGGAEHIETLNFSIPYLKKYSDNEIIVVTDTTRNEIQIKHNLIYDIQTPKHFDHHQASIFLKTGLNQFLDMATNIQYCYLDTDVIAIRPGVDKIFSFYEAPITFCSDHCRMDSFSPYAVYDVQSDQLLKKQKYLNAVLAKHQELEDATREQSRFHERQIKKITEDYRAFIPENIFDYERQWANLQTQYFENLYPKEQFNPLVYFHSLFLFTRKVKQLNPPRNAGLKVTLAHFILSYGGAFFDKLSSRLLQAVSLVTPPQSKNKIKKCLHGDLDFIAFFEARGFRFDAQKKKWYSPKGDELFLPEYDFQIYIKKRGYKLDIIHDHWYNENDELVFQGHSYIKDVERETGFSWDEEAQCWKDKEENILQALKSDALAKLIEKKFGLLISKPNWQHWNGGVFLFDNQSDAFLSTWHQWTLEIFKDPHWKTRDQGTLIATAWNYGLQNHKLLPIEYNFIADYYHLNMDYKGDFTFDLNEKGIAIQPYFLHVYHHFGDQDWKLWQDIENLL